MSIWKAITTRGTRLADAAMRLGTFDVARPIDAPADEVWDLLVDTETWPEWGPSVRDVDVDQRRLTPHTTGRVKTAAGIWMAFEVTDWDEGERWVWDVEGVRATGHRVEPIGPRSCRLVFEVPSVAAPYAAVCRRAAARIARLAED